MPSAAAVRAYVGMGANLGDPGRQLLEGAELIRALPGVCGLVLSSLWRTAPVGKTDQPEFINAAAGFDYAGEALGLLDALLDIESRCGRVRLEKWGPRVLDLDLLLFGDSLIEEPRLRVPHPEMHRRAFVLIPLAEIAPDLVIPGTGRTCGQWLAEMPAAERTAQKVERA